MSAYIIRNFYDQQGGQRHSLLFWSFLFVACLLVATAPIYWLPGLPLPAMTAIKNAAFVGAVGLAFLVSGARFIRVGIALPFIVAAALNFIAFQINGSSEHAGYQALIYLAPMAWVLAIQGLDQEQAGTLLKFLPLPLALIALAVLYAFLAKLGVLPDIRPPLEGLQLAERELSVVRRISVSSGGFAFARTGWGNGTGMALVLLGALLLGRNRLALGLLVMALAVVATAAMGARGAAIGALAAFALAVMTTRQLGSLRIGLILAMAVVPILTLDYLVSIGILSERFFIIQSNADWFFTLDQLTTGRLGTWVHALENFAKSPLVGVGVQESLTVRHTGEVVGVHNVWLGLLSEGGLMAFLPAAFIFLWCARVIWTVSLFRPVLIFAVGVSLVEPSIIFGTFGNQVAFWTAFALAISEVRRRTTLLHAS